MSKKRQEEVLAQAHALMSERPFSRQNEATFNSLMRLFDAMAEEPETRGNKPAAETREARTNADEEFRSYTRRPAELRTYSPMNVATGSAGGFLVPSAWRALYQARLTSASGLLKAGATVLQTENSFGRPWLHFFSDDSANEAEILAENIAFTSAPMPVAAVKTPPVVKFSTSSLVSSELVNDAAFDLDSYLQSLFAVRVARKFNAWATNDATNGVLAQFTVGATAVSQTIPSLAELTNMQSPVQIDPAYLESDSQPCYLMSPAMRTTLMQQIGTSGNLLYPEIRDGKLLGFPLVTNVDMPSVANSVAVAFGSFKRALLVQDVRPILTTSIERYAELAQVFYAFFHRMGVKLVDSSAVTTLKMHV